MGSLRIQVVLCFAMLSLAKSYHYHSSISPVMLSNNLEPCAPRVPATLAPATLLMKLNSSLSDLDKAIGSCLEKDNSPGGAVISVVYQDTILWSKGYGVKNMSGMYNVY